MVALSHTLHCLSHRRPYYMPYLAWRIPFLSAPNFNANMRILAPYSNGCFDIRLHFLCVFLCVCACVCAVLFFFFLSLLGESVRRSACAAAAECDLNLLTAPKAAAQLNSVWHRRSAGSRGISRRGEGRGRARVSPGLGWVGEESRGELGVPLKPHSTDPRSRAGIKVACFMWLVRYFEVPESPTALTSSSSLVS